jgi:HEAT repeats
LNSPEKTIALLRKLLLTDTEPSVRIEAIQSLAILGRYYPLDIAPINTAASRDPDPKVRIAAIKALTTLNIPSTSMPDQPKIQMTFNAPVYGAAGNIEGNQIINASDKGFEALLNDYITFINELQQKYPTQFPEPALLPIIDPEFQEIQKTHPPTLAELSEPQTSLERRQKSHLQNWRTLYRRECMGQSGEAQARRKSFAFLEGIMEE